MLVDFYTILLISKWNYSLINCRPMMVASFGRCAGFLGSPVFLFNRAKQYNWPQIVAPQLHEAWGTKYLGVPEFWSHKDF